MVVHLFLNNNKALDFLPINSIKNGGITTQADIAHQLGKPQSYIAKIEGKDRKIDILEYVELCEVLKIQPSETIKLIENSQTQN